MILLLITLIFLALRYFEVITWSYWFVCLPLLIEAAAATYLFIKTEIEYMIEYNRTHKDKEE